MPIYMNYNSLAVKGDVTATGYVGWIELNSFQWGVGRGISSPTGGSADRESSAPSVSEITVTKDQDSSTGPLLTEALKGEGVTVIIDFVKTSSGQLAKYHGVHADQLHDQRLFNEQRRRPAFGKRLAQLHEDRGHSNDHRCSRHDL